MKTENSESERLIQVLKGDYSKTNEFYNIDEVNVLPPLDMGLNYSDHADEGGYEIPEEPLLFSKASSTIIGTNDDIIYPKQVNKLDYEAELAIVIGESGRYIRKKEANEYIAGYTCFNDISARDVQYSFSQFFRGKSFDTFAPMGPVVSKLSINEVSELSIQSYVNGEIRQNSNTSDMIFSVDEIIESISSTMTLNEGDIIATGTPEGVGAHSDPPRLLEPHDRVKVEIEKIGTIRNSIEPE